MFSRLLKYIIPPLSFRVFIRRIFYSKLKKLPLEKPLSSVLAGWTGFLAGLLVPFAGYLALFYQEIFRERINNLYFRWKSITNKSLINDLATRRKEIQKIIETIIPEDQNQ